VFFLEQTHFTHLQVKVDLTGRVRRDADSINGNFKAPPSEDVSLNSGC